MRTLSMVLVVIALYACGDDLECGAGTVKRGKTCVPDQDICPVGEVWENGDCRVATVCGEGTTNVGGRCVPNDNLCDTGEVYLDGGCVEQCGGGTLVDIVTGSCVPVDVTAGADVEIEPNDPINIGVGVANTIALPAQGQAVRATGTIAAPADLDGDGDLDNDFDVFVFDGTAGTRLYIEVTAVGAPEVAFELYADGGSYVGGALPLAARNAARQVVLPFTATYSLLIGEGTAIAGIDGLGWTGGDGFTYVAAVTPIANPAPTTSTSGDFEAAGDLLDVPQFHIDVSPGTIIEAWLSADDSTPAWIWFATSDVADFLGSVVAFEPGFVRVPAGGVLLTADHAISYQGLTDFRLQTIEHSVTSLDLSAPVSRPGDAVPPGGVRFYGMTITGERVVRAAAELSLGEADVTVVLLDAELNPVAVSNAGGPERWFTAAVAAGDYVLAVYELGALADAPGEFSFDLSVESWPLAPVGSGIVDSPFTSLETLDIPFATVRDRAYFWVDVVAVGQLTVLAAPSADLDPRVAVHHDPLLSTGDGPNVVALVDDLGAGEDETVSFAAAPWRYFISVEAADVFAASAADLTVDFVGSKTVYIVEGPATRDEPTDLGTLSTTVVNAIGELTPDAFGTTADYWQFSVSSPAWIRIETLPYGSASDDTVMTVWNAAGNPVASDDFSGVGDYALVYVALPAGDYLLLVDEYGHRDGGHYLLEAVVEEQLLCAPGATRCDGSELVVCDAGGQTETARSCAQGCNLGACSAIAEAADNDVWVDAQNLNGGVASIGAGLTVVDGAIDDVVAGRDMDWYTFTIDSAATVSLSTWAPTGLDTELWLYRAYDPPPPDIVEIANNDNAPGTVLSRIGPETLSAGEYWVRVGFAADRVSQSGVYQLTVDVEPLACFPNARVCNAGTLELCNGDGSVLLGLVCISTCADGECDYVLEVEPNDGDAQAQDFNVVALDSRLPIAGQIDNPSDGDWIRFEITANALVRIETVPIGGAGDVDTRLSLYASADTVTAIASDNDGGVGTYSLIDTFLTPDTYYVTVASAASDSGTYLVVIDIVTPECVGTETRCADAATLEQCDGGRWLPWACLATCGGATAACEPLTAEVIFAQPFAAPATAMTRFGAGRGDKLNFVSTPDGALDTRVFLCAAGVPQCDFFTGWLRREDLGGFGNVDQILDWVAPVTGEYLFGVERAGGSGITEVRVTPIPVPKIVSVDYPIAARGAAVVLTGSNLADVNAVTVGGEAVGIAVDSDTQISLDALPDTTPIGIAVPVVVTSATLGASGPFELTVINLLLSEIDANTPGADVAQLVEVSTGFPGLDMTGSGYVVVFVNGADTAVGEAYRSGIALDAVADGDGLIVLGNAGVNPDILFNDSLQNGYDGVAIIQAAALISGSVVSAQRIIDAVAYQAGSTQGQVANLDFLWTSGSTVVDEDANGAVEGDSLQRCTLDRRAALAWEVAGTTSGSVNVCSGGGATNTYAVSGVPTNIPDLGTACVEVVVPALPFGNAMSQVRAVAGISHGFAGQIDIVVTNPASTSVVLIDSVGTFYDFSSTAPFGFADGATPLANIVDTVVGSVICGGGPCFFDPQQPLSTFDGAQAVGTWTVCVGDNNTGITGEIRSFELELTTGP